MKKLAAFVVSTTLAASVLTSCGDSKESGSEAGAGTKETSVASDGWDATDACALLDKAAVGAALNDEVTETNLGLVNQAAGPNAATSECTYTLADGGNATLMARRSPIADNTPEAMAMARNGLSETVKAFGKTIEDVPNLGKSAFFVPGMNQLNVFIDDDKFVILTIATAPSETAKATAVELAGKIGK